MTGHPLDAAIIQAIDNVIKREIAEATRSARRSSAVGPTEPATRSGSSAGRSLRSASDWLSMRSWLPGLPIEPIIEPGNGRARHRRCFRG